jgi:hypothetical protein
MGQASRRRRHELKFEGKACFLGNTHPFKLIACYLRKILDNPRIARHLAQHHQEILAEFQKLPRRVISVTAFRKSRR